MNTPNRLHALRLCGAVLVASLLGVAKTQAQPFGQWDFNSGNLTATVGSDLQYADGAGGLTSMATAFGSCSGFGIPTIAGSNAMVMKFPAATNSMGYYMPTPAANGGGSLVNEYTIIYDLLYPAAGTVRPLLDTDGSVFVAGADMIVSVNDGIGITPGGPYDGTLAANTWHRVGFTVTASEVHKYIDGAEVGNQASTGLDGRLALNASSANTLILANTVGNAAPGYVNSIQLRTNALNAGQMMALGAASGAGIPQIIPPVPSFIQSRSPGPNAASILPQPSINIVLNQGDTTVNSNSIKLFFDGALLGSIVTPTPPTFSINATENTLLDPNSVHSLSLVWQDSVIANNTNTWSFAVLGYQSLTLPAPFYFENFDSVTEGGLPAGWVATNATTSETAGFDLCDPTSDAYKNWLVINTNRLCGGGPCPGFECDTLSQPPVAVNGNLLDSLAHNNLLYFESDNRCNGCYGQIGMCFTPDISCAGHSNVFVGFNSLYTQNQDNIAALEYSTNMGVTWLPVLYYLDDQNGTAEVIRTNGVVDVGATFNTARSDQPAGGTNYGWFICAPVSSALIPYVAGRTNDDQVSSKRLELVRLNQADGQPKVRFRFVYGGTCSWYWGVDDFGLYSINTPVIITQPQSLSVDAGAPATFSVVASSATPLTYQWKFNGGNISGATNSAYTIASVSPTNAGQFQVVVNNSDGPTKSSLATLTVITNPGVVTQPISQVADPGDTVTVTASVRGGRPLTYLWYKNGGFVSSGTYSGSANLVLNNVQPSSSGPYQLVLTNTYGAATSSVAQLTVYCGPITNNLVVHLPFDGNFNDTSGRGNNGAYAFNGSAGDPTATFVAGKLGQAFQYTTLIDGTKFDYATLMYPTDLQLGATAAFSVSMWVNYNNQGDDLPFISNKNWDSSNNQGWGIFCQDDGAFRVQVTGPSSGDKFSVHPSTVIRNGTWHNLVVSFVRAPNSAAGYVYSYVDGVLVDRTAMVTQGTIDTLALPFNNSPHGVPSAQTTWAVNIGQDGTGVYNDNGSAHDLNALIDDLGIWLRPLSAAEARGIYHAGMFGKDLSQALPVETLSISKSGSSVIISWWADPRLKLQRSTSIGPSAVWTDVTGTLGASSATIGTTNAAAFFRLSQ